MLPDPLRFPAVTQTINENLRALVPGVLVTAANSMPVLLNDGGGSKRSLTVSDVEHVLSVAHSETNENKPFATGRTVIRLDLKKINEVTGKPVVLSAYIVIALPKSVDFDVSDAVDASRSLAHFLTFGQVTEGNEYANAEDNMLARLIQGES